MSRNFNSNRIYDLRFYDLRDKKRNQRTLVDYAFDKTLSMFGWKNLPDSIPERMLEMYFQYNGFVLLTDKPDNTFRVFYGGLGGEPDPYYRPTIATIANPSLKWDAQLKICWDRQTIEDSDCVIGINDSLLMGLAPLHEKYASMLAENELSLWTADILARSPWMLSADNEISRRTAEDFINNIFEGKLSIVNDGLIFEGIKEHQLSNNQFQNISGLIQFHQYFVAEWFNSYGLNAMQNGVKKEAISDSEEHMNQDVLRVFPDNMFDCRKDFAERVNEKYGLNIEPYFKGSWADNVKEMELEHELIEAEIEEKKDDGIEDNGIEVEDNGGGEENSPDEEDRDTQGDRDSGEGDRTNSEGDGESEEVDVNININIDTNTEEEEVDEDDREEDSE